MDKIAIGPGYDEDTVDLDAEPGDNIISLAKAKGVKPTAIRALILDRPRHEKIISSVRKTGAAVQLITDGDVAGVIATTDTAHSGVDIYLGQGGAPEGVLAAAALRCVGGQLQTRLIFRKDDERARAEKLGIRDFNRKYLLNDLAKGDVVFAATGVTTGTMLEGVRIEDGNIMTHSIVMRSATKTVREIKMKHPMGDED
jgi:fructose-1,6-bisphosphatase II / sedoheptulose-1,7-bisphosphatase